MKKSTSYLFCLSMAVIGFCVGYTFKNISDNISVDNLKKNSYWKADPIIVNCMGNLIEEETIKKAVHYWAKKNEHILFYQYDYQKNVCDQNKVEGFITLKVDKSLLEDGTSVLARTKKYMINGRILSVEISYRPGTYNDKLLLEHELGHAFGFAHVKSSEKDHIMNPWYEDMGQNFWPPN